MDSQNKLFSQVKRIDERDIVFARQDLFRYFGESSQQFEDYYQRFPEMYAYDDQAISKKMPLGGLNPADRPMFTALFEIMDYIGREEVVSGRINHEKQNWTSSRAAEKVKGAAYQ